MAGKSNSHLLVPGAYIQLLESVLITETIDWCKNLPDDIKLARITD